MCINVRMYLYMWQKGGQSGRGVEGVVVKSVSGLAVMILDCFLLIPIHLHKSHAIVKFRINAESLASDPVSDLTSPPASRLRCTGKSTPASI